jgi:hypothetical protein
VTAEGFGYDPASGELWFAGETAEALLLELQARRRALAAELDELRARLEAPIPDAAYSLEPNPFLVRNAELAERLVRALEVSVAHFEAPLRREVDAGAARSGELGAELSRLGAAEVELRQELAAASEAVSAVEVEAARIEAEADEARRRLEQANADEPAEGDDREQLVATVERLERRRETLGQVNPLAHEEYEAEKARLEELAAQRADLEESLAELEKLRNELTETVERRFAETFDAVSRHFEDVTATVFPGGEGRLRLTEAEEDEEESGVEVELRPAGKRCRRLSLLSGGEKALGAIAFLFALFLARPCVLPPRRGRGRARRHEHRTLRRAAAPLLDRAQFVVITTEADDGSRRRPLRVRWAARASPGRLRRCRGKRPSSQVPRLLRALRPGRVRAADRRAVGRGASARHRGHRRGRRRRLRSRLGRPTKWDGYSAVAAEEPLRRRGRRDLGPRRPAARGSPTRASTSPRSRSTCSSAGVPSPTTWPERCCPSRRSPACSRARQGSC